MPDVHDLGLMVDSRIPIIVLESFDEQRALEMLTRVAISRQLPLFCWSVTAGSRRLGFGYDLKREGEAESPLEVLRQIQDNPDPAIFVLCDFHPYLNTPELVRHLKDIGLSYGRAQHTVVLLSHALKIPPELSRLSATLRLALPSEEQLMAMVREEARSWSERNQGARVRTDNATLQKLVNNLRGLSFADARRLIRTAIHDDGAITDSDLPNLNRAKFELLDMGGVLAFEYDTASFADVGGLRQLRRWLEERREAFLCSDGADAPKGLMLLGVQGSGKSLAARAVAGLWGLPLLRIDMGALYNKFIGETERNLREALALADSMAPCVLWADEIEKGLAGKNSDEGTSRRVMGTLLTWMAERRSKVFIVATANAIDELPPELLRKGRLDEIFFVDLPDAETRSTIFRIHLTKRQHPVDSFDLPALAQAAEGFSGAEIEQAVVSATYTAAARGEALNQAAVLAELAQTRPLSVVMAERLTALRAWARERTVPAG